MNLFAYTETVGVSYPAYISLNRNNYDNPILTVRTRGEQNSSCIPLTTEEIVKLRDSLTKYLETRKEE